MHDSFSPSALILTRYEHYIFPLALSQSYIVMTSQTDDSYARAPDGTQMPLSSHRRFMKSLRHFALPFHSQTCQKFIKDRILVTRWFFIIKSFSALFAYLKASNHPLNDSKSFCWFLALKSFPE